MRRENRSGWMQGTEKYWTSKMVKDLMDDFDAQAALYADSQRAAN
jgi:hypothetical protein